MENIKDIYEMLNEERNLEISDKVMYCFDTDTNYYVVTIEGQKTLIKESTIQTLRALGKIK